MENKKGEKLLASGWPLKGEIEEVQKETDRTMGDVKRLVDTHGTPMLFKKKG